jgi:Sulfotransferase family
MNDSASRRFFFVHIMKTGGATLRQHIYANFDTGAVFPVPSLDDMDRAWLLDYLLQLPPDRRATIRGYMGHYPYVATQLLGEDLVTLSILRDPVERTISYLKHCKRYHHQHRDLSLDEIYDDPFHFACFVANHQTKVFSMTTEDRLESFMDVIAIDDRRLALAKDNLERVDVLGVHERYDEFVSELQERFEWRFDRAGNRRVSRERWNVSPALRRRIVSDNAADVELYEHALALQGRRTRTRDGS